LCFIFSLLVRERGEKGVENSEIKRKLLVVMILTTKIKQQNKIIFY